MTQAVNSIWLGQHRRKIYDLQQKTKQEWKVETEKNSAGYEQECMV